MTLPLLADRGALEAALGIEPLTGLGATRAEAVLARVSALVRSEAGRTWATTPPPDAVVAVVLEVAQRVFLNPRNVQSSQTGPFAARYAMVGLSLTAAEKADIDRAVGRRRGGLRSIETTRGDQEACETAYVPTGPPPEGEPFPWYHAGQFWP